MIIFYDNFIFSKLVKHLQMQADFFDNLTNITNV